MVSYREEEKTVLSDRYLNLNFILLLQAEQTNQNMALADMIP